MVLIILVLNYVFLMLLKTILNYLRFKVFRNGFIWNPSICECDKSCDVAEYLDYANSRCRKRLNKLVLECEDEMLNTTDTISIADKKVKCKNNCLIYITIIVLSIMCLILLAIVFISCYYYTKYWVKKENSMP